MSTSSSSQSPSTTTPSQQNSLTSSLPPNTQPTALPEPTTIKHKPNAPFTPTPSDVLSLRHTLLHFVPLELANIIINDAEYWPVLTSSRDAFDGPALVSAHTGKEERKDGKDGWCYVVSPEVPKLDEVYVKVQRVKFSVGVFYEKAEGGCEGKFLSSLFFRLFQTLTRTLQENRQAQTHGSKLPSSPPLLPLLRPSQMTVT